MRRLEIDRIVERIVVSGCRIADNGVERARAWAKPNDRLVEPALWDWPRVEKHARQLIRVLRTCA